MAKSGLIVTYYFPPTGGGGAQRWLKLIKYLSKLDWHFTVIAGSHESQLPLDKTLLNDLPPDTNIIRIKTASSRSILKIIKFFNTSGFWQRWLSALFYITDSRKSWNNIAKPYILKEIDKQNFDAVIFSCPPYSLAMLAADLTLKIKSPVYLDLRDPWSINPYKIYPTPFHRYIDRKREIKTLGNVKNIISVYRSTLNDYDKHIKDFKNKNTLLLANGFDEDDFRDIKKADRKPGDVFNIGFSGSIYSHLNKPDPVFAAIRILKKENIKIHFHHVGTTVLNLKSLAKKYKIENQVILHGYKNHSDCLKILSSMDALCLILDERKRNARNTIGGKIYEYLRLKIPIFAIIPEEGEAAQLIRITNSGVIVPGNNIGKIAQTLKILARRDFTFSWEGLRKFDRENQAKLLKTFLEK